MSHAKIRFSRFEGMKSLGKMSTKWLTSFGVALPLLFLAIDEVPARTQEPLTGKTVLALLDDEQRIEALPEYAVEHPDYPAALALKALAAHERGQAAQAQTFLEKILVQKNFEAQLLTSTAGTGPTTQVKIGTAGTFHLWRDLVYLLQGRIHYEKKDFGKAAHFYSAIPVSSPLHPAALIEQTWALLHVEDWKSAQEKIDAFARLTATDAFKAESVLQQAYLHLQLEQPEKTRSLLTANAWPTKEILKILARKTLAQSEFEIFLGSRQNQSYGNNLAAIQGILRQLEDIPPTHRDGPLSFLAAESYWHLASLHRVHDPDGLRPQWLAALEKADQWLRPYFERSARMKKPLLNEEALFFSAVIAWERDDKAQAVQRLHALPELFPQGEYLADTHQLLGDYYFEKRNFQQALIHFRRLVEVAREEKASYGTFKAAWAFYNLEKKWQALRHFQMLSLHYQRQWVKNKTLPAGHLQKESDRDMRLLLAELMPHAQAAEELELFKYEGEAWIDAREELARTYTRVGKFHEAIAGWKDLLERKPDHARRLPWLQELLGNYLSNGQRLELRPALDRYYKPVLAQKLAPEGKDEFEDKIGKILLIIHREGRKTDDAEIWKATDQLYEFFYGQLGHLQNGEIWYHGAQRQESLAKTWDAVGWYKKAAVIKSFENHDDAAHSVVRLLQQIADRESLKKDREKTVWERIAETAYWYIQNFSEPQTSRVAHRLYLEAAHISGQIAQGHRFLLQAFQNEGASDHWIAMFGLENRRLYEKKDWPVIYDLAERVFNRVQKANPRHEFLDRLQTVQQEAAFQQAYLSEKADLRKWYRRVIAVRPRSPLSLKAWHNLLLSHQPEEIAVFEESLADFEKRFPLGEHLTGDDATDLIKAVYLKYIDFLKVHKRGDDQARIMEKISPWFEDERKHDMLYQAALLFAFHNHLADFDRLIQSLPKDHALLTAQANRATISRLYFLLGELQKSWLWLEPLMEKAPGDSSLWVALLDLERRSRLSSSPVHGDVFAFLQSKSETVRKIPFLAPLQKALAGEKELDEIESLAVILPPYEEKNPVKEDGQPDIEQVTENLTQRLGRVKLAIDGLAQSQQKLKTYLPHWAVPVKTQALCRSPQLVRQSVAALEALGRPPLAHPQWPQFERKLGEKISELQAIAEKESEACKKQKQALAWMQSDPRKRTFFCEYFKCKDADPLQISAPNEQKPDFTFFLSLLQKGAWAMAEDHAQSAENPGEKIFYLALVRLAHGDFWNGSLLLKEAAASHPDASFFLALTANALGEPEQELEFLQKVSEKDLHPYHRKHFSELYKENLKRKPAHNN